MTGEPRVAVVTGAGGELGAAIVRRLVRDGYRVAAFDRTDELLRVLSSSHGGDGDGQVVCIAADQTDRRAVDHAFETVTSTFGPPHLIVANAGYAKFGSFLEMPAQTFERHVGVNLTGTFHVCQAGARLMAAARRGGSIVVISSNLALAHSDQVGAYCSTKAALLPLVRTMAAELGVYAIRVNCILPGVVETAMTAPMLDTPGTREELIARTPLGRLGTTEDIVASVAFLASGQASWLTGASLTVDGGQSIYGQPQWIRQDRSVPFEPQWQNALGYLPHTTD